MPHVQYNTEELAKEIQGVFEYFEDLDIPPEKGYAVLILAANMIAEDLGITQQNMWTEDTRQ